MDKILSVIIQREATKQYDSVERRSLLHPNTAQGSVFPLQSYSKKTLRKNVPKTARKYKRNVLMLDHAPWASYNTL